MGAAHTKRDEALRGLVGPGLTNHDKLKSATANHGDPGVGETAPYSYGETAYYDDVIYD